MRMEQAGLRLDKLPNGNLDDAKNTLEYDETTYVLRYLVEGIDGSKGGNSSVFILRDPNGTEPDRAIKISNVSRPVRQTSERNRRRYGRFMDEIDLLRKCAEVDSPNIVHFHWDGAIQIDGKDFPYYVMEKADSDLKEFLLHNPDIDVQTRVQLCVEVFQAIKQLHDMGYYHRDIKPDNVLLFGSASADEDGAGTLVWKIGDLGLIAHREKDYDELGERVGPFGWLSPEAGNKFLTEKYKLGLDCTIDDRSDVFQLGKLIWFIFQHNIPIGLVTREDLTRQFEGSDRVYEAIKGSLSHGKTRRYDMDRLGQDLAYLASEYHV